MNVLSGSVDTALILLVLTAFVLLGSSRLGSCIRVVALQGVLLGYLTLAARGGDSAVREPILAIASTGLKGIAFPWLLSRALRDAEVRREVEPIVGYRLSLVIGMLALAVSLWLAARLPLPAPSISSFVIPVALFMLLTGLFLIVARRTALTQALGYLVMENGIYAFGVGLVEGTPMLLELGILLDVFVAVFVMGIAIFHISREFDHIDTDRMTTLRDWTP
jgi:hydrogenase-4 component E